MKINKFIRAVADKILKLKNTEKGKRFSQDDEIIEFWLDNFNENIAIAFAYLVELYTQILHKDPQWHYFYEDHYSLVRCSLKYRDKVKKFFDDRNISYSWPVSAWCENLHTTNTYRKEFKDLFHNFSVLAIKMHLNKDGKHLHEASDRVCHCFFNHATYLAHAAGLTKNYEESGYPVDYWEAAKMAELTVFRSYNIGRCKQQRNIAKYFSDATGIDGTPNEIYGQMVALVKAADSVLEEKEAEKCSE